MEILLGLFLFVLLLFIIAYFLYASMIGKKNTAKEALSGIDVQLKKRSNLVPNILKIAQKFMSHEKGLLEEVTKLRSQLGKDYDKTNPDAVKEHIHAAEALQASMGRLFVSVEAYPDLKSNETMLQAQQTYNEVEEHIAAARRFYNSAVTELNNAIEIFPGNLIAPYANAKPMPFYEAEEAAKQPIDADEFLK